MNQGSAPRGPTAQTGGSSAVNAGSTGANADSKTSTTLKTRAKDTIWSDPKGFEAKGGAYYTAFTALKATKDEAGFKAAFGAVGAACGACHQDYRGPE